MMQEKRELSSQSENPETSHFRDGFKVFLESGQAEWRFKCSKDGAEAVRYVRHSSAEARLG
jgi:hypothetical protein